MQVWKEVDGIFTGDPRRIPQARILPLISPYEAAELTLFGAEVLHPFTIEQAMDHGVPIRIKNILDPEGQGTMIFPDYHSKFPYRVSRASGEFLQQHPTAVTAKTNVCVLNIRSNRKDLAHGFFAKVFGLLEKHRISVDLISTSQVQVSMAIEINGDKDRLEKAIHELGELGEVTLSEGLAIVALIGERMRHMIGMAGTMFSILAQEGNNKGDMMGEVEYIISSNFLCY